MSQHEPIDASKDEHLNQAAGKATSEDHQLVVAGKLAKAFITSPLSSILFFAMLGAGIVGLMSTPRQEDPQISVPMIDLFVEYPGASSEEVANIIV